MYAKAMTIAMAAFNTSEFLLLPVLRVWREANFVNHFIWRICVAMKQFIVFEMIMNMDIG